MKNILITGGPVHAHLDAVKVITNRFRGGLMCDLAEQLLQYDTSITYVCAPRVGAEVPASNKIEVVEHTGFYDYQEKVLERAPYADGVILGAAVANLIPVRPFAGKFPSHNYKPGDIIPIDFTIASRVIDAVKTVAPGTQLFGFKLLSGVPYEELMRAAYGIVLESHATAVFANDAANLQQKYAVTKERGVHPMHQGDLGAWIWEMLNDRYYSTVHEHVAGPSEHAVGSVRALIEMYRNRFLQTPEGLIFGTVAIRHEAGFVTTGRGKRELDSTVYVIKVDPAVRKVYVAGNEKASLNAPLLAKMFENPAVEMVLHFHKQSPNLPTYPYAPPGTVRDSDRPNDTSFNIAAHGCVLLLDKDFRRL